MKAFCVMFVILLSAITCFAQDRSKLSYYGEVSYTKVLNPKEPAIKNLPHKAYEWNALDGNQFTADEKRKALYYRLPLSLKIGASMKTEKQNLVSVGLSYNHFSRTDSLGEKLRYTDQIEASKGFVSPSYYKLTSGYYIYRTVGLDVNFLFDDAIGSYQHRFGFGLGVHRLLGSRYFLNHFNSQTGEFSDFSAKDLTLKDKIWIFNPVISYQVRVYNAAKSDVWLISSMLLNSQKKYEKEPLGHILSMGARVYFN